MRNARSAESGRLAAFGVLFAAVGFLLALFGSLDHPESWIGLRQFPFRYAPTGFACLAILCFFFGGQLLRLLRSPTILFALILILYHLAGSIAFSFVYNLGSVQESYLGRGLNMVAILAGAAIGANPLLLKGMGRLMLPSAIAISVLGLVLLTGHSLGLWFNQYDQLIRTPMVLLAPALALLCNRYPSIVLRVGIIGILVINGWLSAKSTHYLLALGIAALTFGGDVMGRFAQIGSQLSRRGKTALAIIASPLALILLGVFSWIFAAVVEERATRYEYDARLRGVEYRIDQIIENPIFGEFFIATTNLSEVMNFGKVIPSHNDWLDLVAAGGLVALAMFLIFLLPALFGAAMRISLGATRRQVHIVHYAWYMVFFYILGASGNPMLSDPYLSIPAWTAVGIALGCNVSMKARDRVAPRRGPVRRVSRPAPALGQSAATRAARAGDRVRPASQRTAGWPGRTSP